MSRAVVVIAKAEPRNDHFSVSEAGNAGVAVVEVRIVHDDRTGPCFSVVEADEHSVLSDGVDVLDTEARCGRIKNSTLGQPLYLKIDLGLRHTIPCSACGLISLMIYNPFNT